MGSDDRYMVGVRTHGGGFVPTRLDRGRHIKLYEKIWMAEAAVARRMIEQYREVVAHGRLLLDVDEPDEVLGVTTDENGDLFNWQFGIVGNINTKYQRYEYD